MAQAFERFRQSGKLARDQRQKLAHRAASTVQRWGPDRVAQDVADTVRQEASALAQETGSRIKAHPWLALATVSAALALAFHRPAEELVRKALGGTDPDGDMDASDDPDDGRVEPVDPAP